MKKDQEQNDLFGKMKLRAKHASRLYLPNEPSIQQLTDSLEKEALERRDL
jgi:hypothetical protein